MLNYRQHINNVLLYLLNIFVGIQIFLEQCIRSIQSEYNANQRQEQRKRSNALITLAKCQDTHIQQKTKKCAKMRSSPHHHSVGPLQPSRCFQMLPRCSPDSQRCLPMPSSCLPGPFQRRALSVHQYMLLVKKSTS